MRATDTSTRTTVFEPSNEVDRSAFLSASVTREGGRVCLKAVDGMTGREVAVTKRIATAEQAGILEQLFRSMRMRLAEDEQAAAANANGSACNGAVIEINTITAASVASTLLGARRIASADGRLA